MKLASNTIRACIAAPAGKKLVVADLSNIEGRVAAWLAGEDWKLRAFEAFDAGTGPDLYKLAYASSFGIKPQEVDSDQRQIGKVQELALQYEGGVAAFVTFATAYNIDLDKLARDAWPNIPDGTRGQAIIMLEWHRDMGRNPPADNGMSEKTWLAIEAIKLGWRGAHPMIKGMWRELRDEVTSAIVREGVPHQAGPLSIVRKGSWLWITLPSGRALGYPSPAFRMDPVEVDDDKVPQTRISYYSVSPFTHKWDKVYTYGGKLFENIVQAVARDVMAWNMPAIEAEGYEIVLTVHDEVVTEAPDTPGFHGKHLAGLLAATPPWAKGLPLAAAGFEAMSYRKG
jgi:DNA polymerase